MAFESALTFILLYWKHRIVVGRRVEADQIRFCFGLDETASKTQHREVNIEVRIEDGIGESSALPEISAPSRLILTWKGRYQRSE